MKQAPQCPHSDPVPEGCDVVVIGAGVGGLTAAALLARAGVKVAVVEAEAQPGGYLACFRRRGFSFNTSVEWLNQCGPGGFVFKLFHSLGDPQPPHCPPLQRIRRFKSETFDYLLTSEPDELKNRMIEDFPESAPGIRRFFDDARALGRRLQPLDRKIMGSDSLGWSGKGARALSLLWSAMPLLRFIRTPVERGLTGYFKRTGPQAIFNSQPTLMSIMVSIAWAYSNNYQGCPQGGSGVIADWLCDRIRDAGSLVVLNRRVDRILLDERGEAAGVQLAEGSRIGSRFVIAACDILTLYEKMLPPAAVSSKLLKALRTAELYHSCFSIFLGLDCHPGRLGFGVESLCLSRSDVSRDAHSGGDPHCSHITVIAPSIADPSLAPPGKGTLIVHCPAYLEFRDNWQTGTGMTRGEEYRALKREVAEILLDRVAAAIAPDLRAHIEFMEIATPVTYWRYTGNTKGSVSGVKPTGKNIRAGVAHQRTAVKRLLLGGHCAEYGGGVPMAVKAAANASLIVLQDLAPAEYRRLKAIMTG